MRECGRGLLRRLRQRDPGLDAEQAAAAGPERRAGAFGMRDAAAGRHPVHVARHDRLVGAEAVAVLDRAVEQIRDRREADMRMRAHVEPVSGEELARAHLVEEDERSDHLPLARGQRTAHLEAADVVRARHDHLADAGRHDFVRCCGIGLHAHEAPPCSPVIVPPPAPLSLQHAGDLEQPTWGLVSAPAVTGTLDRQSGRPPFRIAVFQAPDAKSARAQNCDCLERKHAVRAAAVGDDLALSRQQRHMCIQCRKRDIQGTWQFGKWSRVREGGGRGVMRC